MSNDLLFQNSTHQTFQALIVNKYISRSPEGMSRLSIELKYDLVRLSSLGVLVFSKDRIQLAEGMEGWIKIYWNEVSKSL